MIVWQLSFLCVLCLKVFPSLFLFLMTFLSSTSKFDISVDFCCVSMFLFIVLGYGHGRKQPDSYDSSPGSSTWTALCIHVLQAFSFIDIFRIFPPFPGFQSPPVCLICLLNGRDSELNLHLPLFRGRGTRYNAYLHNSIFEDDSWYADFIFKVHLGQSILMRFPSFCWVQLTINLGAEKKYMLKIHENRRIIDIFTSIHGMIWGGWLSRNIRSIYSVYWEPTTFLFIGYNPYLGA